jgi:hypothetical protein
LFLLGPNILLNTLFSNTLNVSDQVSHPYKTTGKIIVLYILIFKFLDKHYFYMPQIYILKLSKFCNSTHAQHSGSKCFVYSM